MPSDLALKTMNRLHRAALLATGGRKGWTLGGMPVVEVTTIGRKTGLPRPLLLTSPWRDGDRLAIIASAGGNDAHPAWFLNLRDNPRVTVRTADDVVEMTARVTAGRERSDIWEAAVAAYGNYATYQAKTDREIPVVVLEPAATEHPRTDL